jgi:hypothetical protein
VNIIEELKSDPQVFIYAQQKRRLFPVRQLLSRLRKSLPPHDGRERQRRYARGYHFQETGYPHSLCDSGEGGGGARLLTLPSCDLLQLLGYDDGNIALGYVKRCLKKIIMRRPSPPVKFSDYSRQGFAGTRWTCSSTISSREESMAEFGSAACHSPSSKPP